jgi:hypothetical protein
LRIGKSYKQLPRPEAGYFRRKEMKFKGFVVRSALACVVAFGMCACSTVDYRSTGAAIEVIESNFVESTNDSEVVLQETPSSFLAMVKALIRT